MEPYRVKKRLDLFKKFFFYPFFSAATLFVTIIAFTSPLCAGIVAVGQIEGFKSPTRVVLTNDKNIYVSDTKLGKVFIFDTTGKNIGTLEGFSAPLGLDAIECRKFKEKKDKCKEANTIVFVGDEGNGSVQVFIDGNNAGALGIGEGEFGKPNSIAVTDEFVSYVVDSKTNQVKVYDSLGNLLNTFGNTRLDFPTDIALNESLGEVYVADFNNRRIVVFSLGGIWLRDISTPPNDMGDPIFFRPSGLGIDPAGNLYVVDNALSCVAVIDSQGLLLDTIGYMASPPDGQYYWTGELTVPIDAASDGQKIYVTSNKDRQIRIFEVIP